MSNNKQEVVQRLLGVGVTYDDAIALRRIAMTLHRWHELECGIEGGGIERDEATGKVQWYNSITNRRYPYPDKETGAVKRLRDLMSKYDGLSYYIQGDPRGAPLYIGVDIDDTNYTRGVAVYK